MNWIKLEDQLPKPIGDKVVVFTPNAGHGMDYRLICPTLINTAYDATHWAPLDNPDRSKAISTMIEDQQAEIAELKLLNQETTILLTASTAAEKRLMDGIREHKEDCETLKNTLFNHDEIDTELHKLLGEVEV